MKKVMCLAVSMFMLLNLSFAATLNLRTAKNLSVEKSTKITVNMKDRIKLNSGTSDVVEMNPIKMRIGEDEPIPVPTPVRPVLEIM